MLEQSRREKASEGEKEEDLFEREGEAEEMEEVKSVQEEKQRWGEYEDPREK